MINLLVFQLLSFVLATAVGKGQGSLEIRNSDDGGQIIRGHQYTTEEKEDLTIFTANNSSDEDFPPIKRLNKSNSQTVSIHGGTLSSKGSTVLSIIRYQNNGTLAKAPDGSNVKSLEMSGNPLAAIGTITWGSSYGSTSTSKIIRIRLPRGSNTQVYVQQRDDYYLTTVGKSEAANQFWYFINNGYIRSISSDLCVYYNKEGTDTFGKGSTCIGDSKQLWYKDSNDVIIRPADTSVNFAMDSGYNDGRVYMCSINRGDYQKAYLESTGYCWVKYVNGDRPGNDLYGGFTVTSEDECLQRCSYHPWCLSITYFANTRNCNLKQYRALLGSYPDSTNSIAYDFYCDHRTDWPAGKYSNSDTKYWPIDCPAGSYCPSSGMSNPIPCPAGYTCPNTAATNQGSACPAGYYCPQGTSTPIACPGGTYFLSQSSTSRLKTNHPSPVSSHQEVFVPVAPATPISSAQQVCRPSSPLALPHHHVALPPCVGYICPAMSSAAGPSCGTGYYSDAGASVCSWCGSGTKVDSAHWAGGPLRSQCVCAVGWTGTNCEVQKCADVLPGVSLISILFNADKTLTQYSAGYSDDSTYIYNAKLYLKDLLSVGVDFSGDGNITISEVTSALKYRSLWSPNMQAMVLWCKTAISGSYCYQDISTTQVDLNQVYSDAITNFVMSAKHKFDGSGVALLSTISATYPTPTWSDATCRTYDSSYSSFTRVSAQWGFKTLSTQTLNRVCGYMNGALSAAFTTTDVLKGTTTVFTDNVAVSSDNLQKRLYCLGVDVVLTSGVTTSSYECAVGLFYDGTPVDLLPVLTMNGVVFQYTDTSSNENEFDIFVGDVGSTDDAKRFVVGINYPATSCGRTTKHISFTDKENMNGVGKLLEYGIRTIQTINSVQTITKMSTFAYRIPFLTRVTGDVATPGGVGIKGIKVSLCHIDPATGVNNLDTNYCPLISFVTDTRGHFEGEIRVSNTKWINNAEYFNATASLTETMEDGTAIVHVFDPPSQIVKMAHTFGFSTVMFTDMTTVTVFGSVIFDPNAVAKNRCPFAGVTVMMIDSTGSNSTVTSGSDGSFSFSLTRGQSAVVSIPYFNGYSWISNITTVATTQTQSTASRRGLIEGESYIELTDPSEFAVWEAEEDNVPGNPGVPEDGRNLQATTSVPTSIPSTVPTQLPTFAPSIRILDGATTQLLHRYTFNNDLAYGTTAHDDAGNTDATLVNGVTIANGKAVFASNPSRPVPYIQLPYAVLGNKQAVTIECWADFDAANDPRSTLFSFGASPSSLSFSGKFTNVKSIYIAVVYNITAGYTKVYLNGVLSQKVVISKLARLGGSYNLDAFNFIGRNLTSPNIAMTASIDEFRVWYGELDSKTIQSNYRTGVNPSQVTITSNDARSNVQITFMATSLQPINIGFYGGVSQFPMFGPETQVILTPVDSQCKYTPKLTLNRDTSSAQTMIAAMNYTVTLLDAGLPAPAIASTVCDPSRPTITNCFCGSSKTPFQYVTDTGLINQTLTIAAVDTNVVFVNYSYRSGVCFEVQGAEQFSLVDGNVVGSDGCYKSNTVVLAQGDVKSVTVYPFELYPKLGISWFTKDKAKAATVLSTTDMIAIDFNVTYSSVVIKDLVSARQPQTFSYQYNLVLPTPQSKVAVAQGLSYSIQAAYPIFIAPFSLKFSITLNRDGLDGTSYATNTWYIPITGALANEVPNYYPVATDPTLIYMVLRDPPGGGSSTTFHAGTDLEFSLSIDNMRTFVAAKDSSDEMELGADGDIKLEAAPLGFGVAETALKLKAYGSFGGSTSRTVTAARSSHTSYDFSIKFEYDIATSSDPNIAGHASDVIVGGAIDLIVSQAKQVVADPVVTAANAGYTCYKSQDTFQWQPGRSTTFVFAVYEIQNLIDSLQAIVDLGVDATVGRPQTTIDSLKTQIGNWNSVLATYQSYNDNTTAMFTQDTKALLKVITDFNNYDSTRKSDFQAILNKLLKDTKNSFSYGVGQAQVEVTDACTSVLPSYQNDHLSNICNNFKTSTWTTFMSAVESVCDNTDTDSFKTNFPYLSNLCTQKALDQSIAIPGGYSQIQDKESMFGFLKSKQKYITFGADAPFTMSYTSTISQSISMESEMDFDVEKSKESGGGFEETVVVVFEDLVSEGNEGTTLTYHLGYGKDSQKKFERTVSVELADEDMGDYFVVRMTEDPVYGTPIFTTMGGISKCPGESGTQRRESRVSIKSISEKCCQYSATCSCQNLPSTATYAYFSLFVYNLSPSGDAVYYTAEAVNKFDECDGLNAQSCGSPGYKAGLSITFPETDLAKIPYNKLVEVPFYVMRGHCNAYKDIEVRIVATCEAPTTSSYVIQYGIVDGKISYLPENILGASESVSTFSVSWATA